MPRVTESLRRQWTQQISQMMEERTHDQSGRARSVEDIAIVDHDVAVMEALLALRAGASFDARKIDEQVRAAVAPQAQSSGSQAPVPAPTGKVTVTLTHEGQSVRLHGGVVEEFTALTYGNKHGNWVHNRGRTGSSARRWVSLCPLVAKAYDLRPVPDSARDWRWTSMYLEVCIDDTEGVTIEPLGADAQAWLLANESPTEKRDRLLARFAEFDPEAAAALEDTILALVADAREDESVRAQWGDRY